jgi:UDP-N-acetylglucosamine--N-acetylmuramyl-(pentapeptide) pyrophosphoryl-undecaprenol N-acetylglucosamine transferase
LTAVGAAADMSVCSRILLTGGGTAGHVNPALAIGRALGDERTRFLYVGVKGRAEAQVVPREGLPITFVRAAAYPGSRPSPAWIPFLINLTLGTLKALFVVRRFRPGVIVGTGGFAAAPVMFAAGLLRRLGLCRARIYVHEQNAAPGRLNLLVGRIADRVFVSFPETLATFPSNGWLAGYPLRRRIQPSSRAEAQQALDFPLPEGRFVVFAFGGSQGARTINHAVVDALRDLLPHRDRLFVIHGTGLTRDGRGYDPGRETEERLRAQYTEAEREAIATFYVSRPYFHGIEHVYALTDLAVVRAGAGTLCEIAALGIPSVAVPKVNLPGEHQVMNARALARCGGAVVLYEETRLIEGALVESLDGATLAASILGLSQDGPALARMAAGARSFIRGDALETIRRRGVRVPVTEAAVLGAATLLARLDRACGRSPAAYRVEDVVPSADDRAYYVSRATSLLAARAWESRNLGIKLIGLLQAREKLPLVLTLLTDRRPAPWYKRALGGDFEQVGFIRRNALTTIARLGVVTPEVEAALGAALDDPYYEVRAEAARSVAALGARISEPGRRALVVRLAGRLADAWLEVAAAAAETLGRVGDETTALPALLALQSHRYWMVRSAGLRGLLSLVERGRAGDLADLERQIRGFVLTATDFRPEFTIKTAYAHVLDAIARQRSQGS